MTEILIVLFILLSVQCAVCVLIRLKIKRMQRIGKLPILDALEEESENH